MAIQLSTVEAAAIASFDAKLDTGFHDGAEWPFGVQQVPKLEGYDKPMLVAEIDQSAIYKPKIRNPFTMVMVALLKTVQPAWTNVTSFLNNWRQWPDGNYPTCQYRRSLLGTVQIRGIFSAPASAPGKVIFNIPAGYRPLTRLMFNVTSQDALAIVEMNPNGDLTCRTGPSGNSPTSDTVWYNILITYEAEQ